MRSRTLTELACDEVCRAKGYTRARVGREIRAGSSHVHSLFRDALARGIAARLGDSAEAVYLYGSTNENRAGLLSDIDLLVLVNGHRAVAERRLKRLERVLRREYASLLRRREAPDRFIDYHFITEQDVARGTNYADALTNRYGPYPQRLRVRATASALRN
jgi:predicted nucleotidyltransferase